MIAALAVLAVFAQNAPPPSYEGALRCAAAIEATLETTEIGTAKSRLLHQAAIYWGATAADEAKKRKVTSEQFSADQASYRRTQGLLLATGDPGAETQVSACVTQGNR